MELTKKRAIGFIILAVGVVIACSTLVVGMFSLDVQLQLQASSPVVEGEVSSINIRIKTGVGVSGTVRLFVDNVFYTAMGGHGGSDGIIYFSTGWKAVGVGNHVLRACYFMDDYPTQPYEALTVITVTDSEDSLPDPVDPVEPVDPDVIWDPVDPDDVIWDQVDPDEDGDDVIWDEPDTVDVAGFNLHWTVLVGIAVALCSTPFFAWDKLEGN